MKTDKDINKLVKSKAYYAVIVSLVLMIVGVSAAIIGVTKVKDTTFEVHTKENTEIYTVPTTDYRANLNQTGVADERTTEKPAVSGNVPYKGNYTMPVENKVIKNFSDGDMVFSKTMQDWRTHNGIDILSTKGESVRAVDDGVVAEVRNDEMWGGIVSITHKNGLTVKYMGVKPGVKVNSNVIQGDIIAQVDTVPVESSDEIHLHLECTVDNVTVDPVKALNLTSQSVE